MFLNPEEILKKIGLKGDERAADFGCGSGGFTIPLAEKLENGFVFAFDIQEEPLNVLKSRSANLSNLRFHKCDLEVLGSSKIEDSSLDLVLIINTLFQAEEPEKIIEEAKRVLRRGGRLLIVEWQEGATQGPEEKISLEKLEAMAKGFKKEKEIEAGRYHYGLLMEKS